ncbi:MAG: histidine kinase [Acidobacteria bacterium]|nr:histidine kinase [Acidobacteriota bacterium]
MSTTRSDKRILVVDDDDAIRSLLFTVLRRRGFQVDTGRNGVEALERCSRCRYSVILLDLMMPRMNGWEVIDHLEKKAAEERPLVIVLTAGGEPRDLPAGLVVGTVRKPFDIELLVDTVVGCLTSMEARDQRPECPPAESERPRALPIAGGEKPN